MALIFFVAFVYSHCCQTNQNRLTMSITSPFYCVSNAFSLYPVSLCLIYCNWYHSTNQIRSIVSLTIMGMTPGPLVRALFLFALMNPLVVLETPFVVLENMLVV